MSVNGKRSLWSVVEQARYKQASKCLGVAFDMKHVCLHAPNHSFLHSNLQTHAAAPSELIAAPYAYPVLHSGLSSSVTVACPLAAGMCVDVQNRIDTVTVARWGSSEVMMYIIFS
jgi:hypothetical protein